MNELRTLASLVKKVADLHEASWDEHLGEYRYTVSVGDAITQVCQEPGYAAMKKPLELLFLCWNAAIDWADEVLKEPEHVVLTHLQQKVAIEYVHARNKAREASKLGQTVHVEALTSVLEIDTGSGVSAVPTIVAFRFSEWKDTATVVSYKDGELLYETPRQPYCPKSNLLTWRKS